jgi:hypothetical protein
LKFKDWVLYEKDKKTVFIRDWADGKSVCAVGNGKTEKDTDDFDWVAITSNPNKSGDWRFMSLDVMMLSLIELFGRDNVREVLEKVQPYEKIKDIEFSKDQQ